MKLCKCNCWLITEVIFRVCLFLFSTCFGQPCAHYLEKLLYQCDIWFMSLCVDDGLVCIPDGRPHRVTYTRYGTDTVNSPDDGRIVARNM